LEISGKSFKRKKKDPEGSFFTNQLNLIYPNLLGFGN